MSITPIRICLGEEEGKVIVPYPESSHGPDEVIERGLIAVGFRAIFELHREATLVHQMSDIEIVMLLVRGLEDGDYHAIYNRKTYEDDEHKDYRPVFA
jgi:hypothetical protein